MLPFGLTRLFAPLFSRALGSPLPPPSLCSALLLQTQVITRLTMTISDSFRVIMTLQARTGANQIETFFFLLPSCVRPRFLHFADCALHSSHQLPPSTSPVSSNFLISHYASHSLPERSLSLEFAVLQLWLITNHFSPPTRNFFFSSTQFRLLSSISLFDTHPFFILFFTTFFFFFSFFFFFFPHFSSRLNFCQFPASLPFALHICALIVNI